MPQVNESSGRTAKDRLVGALTLLLGGILIAIGVAVSSAYYVIDPFLQEHAASIAHFMLTGEEPKGFLWPGLLWWSIVAARATGLPISSVVFLPAAAILFFAASTSIVSKLSRSMPLAALAAVILAFRFELPYLYGLWPHAIGFALFFLLIQLWINRDGYNWNSPRFGISVFVIFLGIHLYSYTAELWAIAFIGSMALLEVFRRAPKRTSSASRLMLYTMVFGITAVGFNQVVFQSFLPKIDAGVAFDSLTHYMFRFTTALGVEAIHFETDPRLWHHSPTPALSILSKTWFLLAAVPLAYLGACFATQNGRRRLQLTVNQQVCIMALSAPFLLDILVYSAVGGATVGLRYIVLVAPVLGAIAGVRMYRNIIGRGNSGRRFAVIHFSALALISMLIFPLFLANPANVLTTEAYREVDSAAHFLRAQTTPWMISTDHHSGSRLSLISAESGELFERGIHYRLYTSDDMDYLLGHRNALAKPTAFLISLAWADSKTWTGGWRDYRPMQEFLPEIDQNSHAYAVYSDGRAMVLLAPLSPA